MEGEVKLMPIEQIFTSQTEEELSESEVLALFTGIYEQWHKPIYRYLCAVNRNPAWAEDVTQDVFLALFKRLQRGNTGDQFDPKAWLFMCARNYTVNEIRRDVVQRNQSLDDIREKKGETLEVMRDVRADPARPLRVKERAKLLAKGMSALSAKERQCVLMRANGLSLEESGEMLNGKGPRYVSQLILRSVERLRKKVNELQPRPSRS
jgi:RNA polymerase sigma-70 factor, ECF subfamily